QKEHRRFCSFLLCFLCLLWLIFFPYLCTPAPTRLLHIFLLSWTSASIRMAGMQVFVLFFSSLQISQPHVPPPTTPATARGDRFQIAVPQGWKILTAGSDVVIEHSSGASLLVLRTDPVKNLPEYALQQAERVMTPLGFAKLGDPRTFKDAHEEWV